MDWFGMVGLGLVVFVSTNIDDIFLLMMFFADRQFQGGQVVVGQYIGMGVLTGVSLIGALVALVIPESVIGLMGIVPIVIGVRKLMGDDDDDADATQHGRWQFLTVTAVMIANGGDNIGVYIPLFATRTPGEIGVMVGVFAVMTAAWCGIAYYLVHHSLMKETIRRLGQRVLPFVLIGLGLYIVYEGFAGK